MLGWDFVFDARFFRTIQVGNRLYLKNETSRKVRAVLKIIFHVRIGHSRARIHLDALRNLVVLVLWGTTLIDRSVKALFPLERNTVLINSGPEPMPFIKDLSEKQKNRAHRTQDVITSRKSCENTCTCRRAKEDIDKVRRNSINRSRCKWTNKNMTTTKVGQYANMNDSFGHSQSVPDQATSMHCL